MERQEELESTLKQVLERQDQLPKNLASVSKFDPDLSLFIAERDMLIELRSYVERELKALEQENLFEKGLDFI